MESPADWFVEFPEKTSGPFTTAQLHKLAERGRLRPETRVRRGESAWQRADEVRGADEFSGLTFADPPAEPKPLEGAYCPKCSQLMAARATSCAQCGYRFEALAASSAWKLWHAIVGIAGAFAWLFAFAAAAAFLDTLNRPLAVAILAVGIVGYSGAYLWATSIWGMAKGHSLSTGLLLGLLGPLGLVLLALIPDRTRSAA